MSVILIVCTLYILLIPLLTSIIVSFIYLRYYLRAYDFMKLVLSRFGSCHSKLFAVSQHRIISVGVCVRVQIFKAHDCAVHSLEFTIKFM
jgi:hypothetical protein